MDLLQNRENALQTIMKGSQGSVKRITTLLPTH